MEGVAGGRGRQQKLNSYWLYYLRYPPRTSQSWAGLLPPLNAHWLN